MSQQRSLIFVHGLWMPGRESHWFRQRLENAHGFATYLFSYRSATEPLDAVLERLNTRVRFASTATGQVDIVAHSLGGLLALALFEKFPQQPVGRVVLLGSPVQGSAAARRLAGFKVGASMLGMIGRTQLLRERPPEWRAPCDLGVIAGTRPVGLGRILTNFSEPNDGTVAVRETRLPGMTGHITLPVSHFGMLLSAKAADQTAEFLKTGRFSLT